MKIDIAQQSSDYSFYKKGSEEPSFKGYFRSPIIGNDYAEIYHMTGDLLSSVRIGNNPWFPWLNRRSKLTYFITFHEEALTVEVTVQHFSKGHWTFKFKGQRFDFYRHRGHRRSLYKNDQQVASYDKRSVNLFEHDRGSIIANDDEDEVLLISLFLCYDMGERNGGEASADFGYLTEGVIKLDPNWLPEK